MEQGIPTMELTLAELAAAMKVTESRIIGLIKNDGLPGYESGCQWRFRIDEVSDWMCHRSRVCTARKNRPRQLVARNKSIAREPEMLSLKPLSKTSPHSDRAPARREIRYRRKA
jgi:excisionase family DNA binding protein